MPDNPKRSYYHATWCGNIEAIKDRGLIPRTEQEAEQTVDAILAEYGFTRDDVPRWRWQYALARLKETAGKVYLTADPMYALQNCLAGFEAEAELRSHLESFKRHKKVRHLTLEEVVRRRGPDISCGICEVELDDSEVEDVQWYKLRWERMSADERQSWGLETFEDYMRLLMREGVNVIMEGSIPPDRIKGCGCVGPTVHALAKKEYARRAFQVHKELGLEMPEERRERYEKYLKGEW